MAGSRRRMRNNPYHNQQDSKPQSSMKCIAISTFLFVVACLFLVPLLFHNSPSSEVTIIYEDVSSIPLSTIGHLDAILVLGGGKPSSVNEPPVFTKQRCDDAAAVLKRSNGIKRKKSSKLDSPQEETSTIPILCLSAGTAHAPQAIGSNGLPLWESTASAAYLQNKHNISNIFVETTSYDTIGNAFFTRTGFTDVNGWRNLLVITNKFHMDRTRVIFDWVFGLDQSSKRDAYKLSYLASPDIGLSDEAIKARVGREMKSKATLQKHLIPKYQSMKDLWSFINRDHDLYTANKLVDRASGKSGEEVDEAIKLSYSA